MASKKPLMAYLKKAQLEQKLDSLMPESEPPEFKLDTESTENLKVEIVENIPEGKKLSLYTLQKPAKTQYLYRRNPNIKPLFNFSRSKIYIDNNGNYWLYMFSPDRKRIVGKMQLRKHDIVNMLAFCIAELHPKLAYSKHPELWVNKTLLSKIQTITQKLKEEF
ncbi:MAG: hypothetical protein QW386_02720 [Candidatus Bathyarchaeia archaeon]